MAKINHSPFWITIAMTIGILSISKLKTLALDLIPCTQFFYLHDLDNFQLLPELLDFHFYPFFNNLVNFIHSNHLFMPILAFIIFYLPLEQRNSNKTINTQILIIIRARTRMIIVDILSVYPFILGLTEDGFLICWNMNQKVISKEVDPDFPFHFNQFQMQILQSNGVSLHKSNTHIYICGQKQLKQIRISDLQLFAKRPKTKSNSCQINLKKINVSGAIHSTLLIQNKTESLFTSGLKDEAKQNSYSNRMDEEEILSNHFLLYATEEGKLFYVNSLFTQSFEVCDLLGQYTQVSLGAPQIIKSMISYRENTLLIVGTSCGRILIISLIGSKVVDDLTSKNNLKLSQVNQLFLSPNGHKFYTSHKSYIIEWSLDLQKPLGYYYYESPSVAILTQKLNLDKERILISGGGRQISIVDLENPKNRNKLELGVESIRVMKQYNNRIWCGGSNGVIQILSLGVNWLTLIRSSVTNFY